MGTHTQGNILDDDRVIRALEELKAEAADVGREVASTAEVMAELKAISDLYEPLAGAVTQVKKMKASLGPRMSVVYVHDTRLLFLFFRPPATHCRSISPWSAWPISISCINILSNISYKSLALS